MTEEQQEVITTAENEHPKEMPKDRTLASFIVTFAYLIWWIVTAFFIDSPDILGIPGWFFYSCILGFGGVIIAAWGIARGGKP